MITKNEFIQMFIQFHGCIYLAQGMYVVGSELGMAQPAPQPLISKLGLDKARFCFHSVSFEARISSVLIRSRTFKALNNEILAAILV